MSTKDPNYSRTEGMSQCLTPTCHSHPWKPWAVLVGCTLRSFLTSSYRFPGNKLSRETGAL